MNGNGFFGPLFIVGMPRSGTKLLRDLLNQNTSIGIPLTETDFIPFMINKFGITPSFNDKNNFFSFYEEIRKTTFWSSMKNQGYVINKEHIEEKSDLKTWSSIFEAILRFYAPKGRREKFIWGDKSPSYLYHMKFLKLFYLD